MEKRLYRSRSERILLGVCGGLARYFYMDPVLVRVIFVLLVFANGLGILAYLILAIVVPVEGSTSAPREAVRENVEEIKQSAIEFGEKFRSGQTKKEDTTGGQTQVTRNDRARNILGIVLVAVGAFLLLGTLNPFGWFKWAYLWPLVLVIVGLIIIFGARRR